MKTKKQTKLPDFWQELWKGLRKNKGAFIGLNLIFVFTIISLLAPLLAPYDPTVIHQEAFRLPPSFNDGGTFKFFLGTDDIGRDLLSRLIYGARISLLVGFSIVVFSTVIGVLLGLVSGYYGGKVDWFIMRLVDIIMAFPSVLLAIAIVTVLGPGLANTVIAVGIVAIPSFIRIVRASVIAEKEKEYVSASLSLGASDFRIIFLEILPNCMAPLIVQATLGFSDGILNAAALGFLGLGVQAPTPEWGTMLADSRAFIQSSPWLVTLPGLCILSVVLGFNLLGDGLRDALDPKLKRN